MDNPNLYSQANKEDLSSSSLLSPGERLVKELEARRECDSSRGLPPCTTNWPHDPRSWCDGCLAGSAAQALQAATARAEPAGACEKLAPADDYYIPERDGRRCVEHPKGEHELVCLTCVESSFQAADQLRVEALALVEQWRGLTVSSPSGYYASGREDQARSCADDLASLLTRPQVSSR
jgi:hypothetical protein